MTIDNLLNRVKALDTDKIAVEALTDTKENLLSFNKEQLLEGKNRLGLDITPSYFDDPYFKTREAAKRYSEWKDRITPNSKRTPGTPNLYIVGTFHNSISLSINKDSLTFEAAFRGKDIEAKYGENIYGLGGEIKAEYIKADLRPAFNSKIEKALNLKI